MKTTSFVPGMLFASMKTSPSFMLPQKVMMPVPSGLIVQRLWGKPRSRSTYSQRMKSTRPSGSTQGVFSVSTFAVNGRIFEPSASHL